MAPKGDKIWKVHSTDPMCEKFRKVHSSNPKCEMYTQLTLSLWKVLKSTLNWSQVWKGINTHICQRIHKKINCKMNVYLGHLDTVITCLMPVLSLLLLHYKTTKNDFDCMKNGLPISWKRATVCRFIHLHFWKIGHNVLVAQNSN